MRLPRPLYESLPALYALAGVAALLFGYRLHAGAGSLLCSLSGLLALIAAAAIALHRRDYRAHRQEYAARGRTLAGEEPRE